MASAVTRIDPADRRSARRFAPAMQGLSDKARLRHGPEVIVVDLSTAGALIEGPCRLRPGAAVSTWLELSGQPVVHACRVVRCHVSAVHGAEGVSYRAALRFDQPLALGGPFQADG
jgi:hypothetical protein